MTYFVGIVRSALTESCFKIDRPLIWPMVNNASGELSQILKNIARISFVGNLLELLSFVRQLSQFSLVTFFMSTRKLRNKQIITSAKYN